jgi:uncharacterized protein YkwD
MAVRLTAVLRLLAAAGAILVAGCATEGGPSPVVPPVHQARPDKATTQIAAGESDLPAAVRTALAPLYGPTSPFVAPATPVAGMPADLDPLSALALMRLNAYRSAAGLAPYRYDASLSALAAAHVRYAMARSRAGKTWQGHFEVQGDAAFTAAGHEAASTSGIAYGDSDALAALEALMAGPYHRLQFLDPADSRVGVGFGTWPGEGNAIALFVTRPAGAGTTAAGTAGAVAAGSSPRFIAFPPNGSSGIPSTFDTGENPDPRPGFQARPLSQRPSTGYPLSIALQDHDARKLTSVEVRLLDPAGTPVPCWVTDPAHPSNASAPAIYAPGVSADDSFAHNFNAIFILPQAPLSRGTAYRVEATLHLGTETTSVTWTFTTAPAAAWHVSTRPGQPWLSTGYALAHAAAGDTILLDPGTYSFDQPINLAGVRLRGAGAEPGQTVLRFPAFSDTTPVAIRGAAVLENLTLESPNQVIYLLSGSTLLLQGAALKGGDGENVAIGLERGSVLVVDGLSAAEYRTSYLCYALDEGTGAAPLVYQRAVTSGAGLVYGNAVVKPLAGPVTLP